MIKQSKSAFNQGRIIRATIVTKTHNCCNNDTFRQHYLISGKEFGKSFSTWNKLLNNDVEEERKKDRKEAQEKMYNIKRELSEFLTAKLDGSKRKEKQEERIKLAQNLGNVMIVAGFIVGLIYYVVSVDSICGFIVKIICYYH
ncbi:predicted protein [Naegleria gruberi]|uniref:Predicted protein n=1 Tax=Naegleria gruberi TaxID=5762 RepID=D2UYH1_NAEGR|nr:uncharacterized protein NAEGRDRAFT_61468 [Naegleria gruberi]EFC50791.1 predicted protein [Naegleria gruberi]|eukprot:XP_002683535.1 predicted protein [Naegleria gruberi strain NEG-M]